MFSHPFTLLMAVTFIAAAVTMMAGVFSLGKPGNSAIGNVLMRLRLAFSGLLLIEILVYVAIIKP